MEGRRKVSTGSADSGERGRSRVGKKRTELLYTGELTRLGGKRTENSVTYWGR